MRIDVLTLFPEMFEPVLGASILGRAAKAEKVSYHLTNIRDHTTNKHGKVDDRPYGGGPGMVMAAQPIWDAVASVESQDPAPATRILTSPQGQPLTQRLAEQLAEKPRLLIIAGHYEGIDQRVIQKLDPMPISIGDYVLSGGELPAMVLIDAIVRLIPGVLGHEDSAHHDSFSEGADRILEGPQYTRPPVWQGMQVPEILLSGDHAAIEAWRKQQARQITADRRPDLLDNE
ncbi:tRNA (guanosine(37)-N1)-methyltransferase TrmD [Planctomycetales bacterium ZRK34]|nr:tRNA (guanosine(37)-N1)-methyltransferase TrmD [Planctomycetales bacterium ZRK34]